MDWANWVAIVLATLALLLSGITYWNDSLKPFHLRVSNAGRAELALNPYRTPNREPALLAEIIFSNDGALSGAVKDVALVVRFPDGQQVLFRSMVTSTDQTQQLGKELGQPRLESFVGFWIQGRDTVVKHILFVLEPSGQRGEFALGSYPTEVKVLSDQSGKWETKDTFTFNVEKGDLDLLAKTSFTLEPDGRYFVNWPRQSKVTIERERALKQLKETISQ